MHKYLYLSWQVLNEAHFKYFKQIIWTFSTNFVTSSSEYFYKHKLATPSENARLLNRTHTFGHVRMLDRTIYFLHLTPTSLIYRWMENLTQIVTSQMLNLRQIKNFCLLSILKNCFFFTRGNQNRSSNFQNLFYEYQ